MEALEQILRAHGLRYPEMEPADAVKLIYQNEFGGGHLIANENAALDYLRREYNALEKPQAVPVEEPIGNGILRIHLAALDVQKLNTLGACFLRSAAAHTGNREQFLAKLALLRSLTFAGAMPFSLGALDAYLSEYRKAGFPMVSHSERYRRTYHPAYRIVLETLWRKSQ